MNRRDREAIHRMSECARKASGLLPSNPANIGQTVRAAKVMSQTLNDLAFALGTMAYDEGALSDIESMEQRLSLAAAEKG